MGNLFDVPLHRWEWSLLIFQIVARCLATSIKSLTEGVPVMDQWLMNPTRNHEGAGSIPALAQRVEDPALP